MKRVLIFENRRNHIEVLSDILELCRGPQAKTFILRSTNTSFKLLERYLLQLQVSSLLTVEPKTNKYVTTTEGQKFVDAWTSLKTMLYPEELPLPMRNRNAASRNMAPSGSDTSYLQ